MAEMFTTIVAFFIILTAISTAIGVMLTIGMVIWTIIKYGLLRRY